MLADSKLLDQLERNAVFTAGRPLCLYGDPAYHRRVHLQGPYKHAVLNPQAFNTSMSEEPLHWLTKTKDRVEYFKFSDFKKT